LASVKIISSNQNSDWHDEIANTSGDDVYFYPEYANSFNLIEGGASYLFVFEDHGNKFLYPFRLRPLFEIPRFSQFKDWYDITSDYGYGGPFTRITDENSLDNFCLNAISAFDDFCRETHVVSEFCRFHPLIDNAKIVSAAHKPDFCNHTICVDLTISEEECWNSIRKGYRYDIRQAEKAGLQIEVSDDSNAAELFYDLYVKTMEKVDARRYYFFNKRFFRDSLQNLRSHSSIFFCTIQSRPIAAAFFIWGSRFLHYNFACVDPAYLQSGANKKLLFEAIKWGKSRNFQKLHLGGGLGGSDTDSLMFFKSGFSKLRKDFFISKRIHDPKMYQKLCDVVSVNADSNIFFPAYRTLGNG
jgi:hypothetical protein